MSFLVNPFVFGGGGLPIQFEWDPENSGAQPGSFSFARASSAWYRNDSGVWVEASSGVERDAHNITPGGGGKGYIPEGATTKLSVHTRDLTDAVWSATNITVALDATGIDGVGSSASTLTADAANGTIFQSVTSASDDHSFQAFVARKTGTGTIEMTIDGGSTYTDITSSLTSSIDNPFVVTQSLTNPSIGFRIVTSGDEIEVDCCELEKGEQYATTPIVNDSASTQSRVADALSAGLNYLTGGWTIVADCTGPALSTGTDVILGTTTTSSFSIGVALTSGEGRAATNLNVLRNVSGSDWEASRLKGGVTNPTSSGGTLVISATGATSRTSTTSGDKTDAISIGYRKATLEKHWRGVIHKVTVYSETVSQAELEALVA